MQASCPPPDIQTKSRESHMLCLLTAGIRAPSHFPPSLQARDRGLSCPNPHPRLKCERVGVLFFSFRQSHSLPRFKSESEGFIFFMLPPPLPLRAPLPSVNSPQSLRAGSTPLHAGSAPPIRAGSTPPHTASASPPLRAASMPPALCEGPTPLPLRAALMPPACRMRAASIPPACAPHRCPACALHRRPLPPCAASAPPAPTCRISTY